MTERKKRYNFDGEKWDKYSTRYQTRRKQEKKEKEIAQIKKIQEYEKILSNIEEYDDEIIRITQLRYKTLIKNQKVQKKEINDENLIPVRLDQKTVYFIRESNLFKPKWVKLFGKVRLQKILDNYKKLLHLKPVSELYWNPF